MNTNICRGYADARDGTPYNRSPEPDMPQVPREMLSQDWKDYWAGWKAGINDNCRDILKRGARQ